MGWRTGATLDVRYNGYIHVLDNGAVAVVGCLGSTGRPYWESVAACARTNARSESAHALPIVVARNGPEASPIGSAAADPQSQMAGTLPFSRPAEGGGN